MPRVVPSQVIAVIDKFFHWVDNSPDSPQKITHGRTPGLLAVIQLIERLPDELLPTNADQYSKFVAGVAAIRDRLDKWGAGIETAYPMPQLREYGANPIEIVRDVLAQCPDEATAHASSELSFIQDALYRDSLRQDLSTVNSALGNGEWKGATVLGGSLCEALLLWKLQAEAPANISNACAALLQKGLLKKRPPNNLEAIGWGLHEYCEVCGELNHISAETLAQVRLAKDFRNLIHPGRAIRLGQKCDRGTALAVVAAVEFIIRDFTHP